MDSSTKEVRDVLSALAIKIKESYCELNSQAIGNTLYGLKNMSSRSEAVKAVLSALATKIEKSTCELNNRNIGNALYGLQNMDSSAKEVKAVLSALATKIEESDCELDGQDIGNALYGLQNMDSSTKEVKAVLLALENALSQPQNENIAYNDLSLKQMSASLITFLEKSITDGDSVLSSIPNILKAVEWGHCTLENFKGKYIAQLKQGHYNRGILDLHNMDHLSMKIIMSAFGEKDFRPTQIIVGKASHAKNLYNNRALRIVQNHINSDTVAQYKINDDNSGALIITYKNVNCCKEVCTEQNAEQAELDKSKQQKPKRQRRRNQRGGRTDAVSASKIDFQKLGTQTDLPQSIATLDMQNIDKADIPTGIDSSTTTIQRHELSGRPSKYCSCSIS